MEQRTAYLVENQVDRPQRWTIGGIAAGFLCRLYLVEPREEYLALARRYQAFSMSATEHQFKYAQVCKSSWGERAVVPDHRRSGVPALDLPHG